MGGYQVRMKMFSKCPSKIRLFGILLISFFVFKAITWRDYFFPTIIPALFKKTYELYKEYKEDEAKFKQYDEMAKKEKT